MSNSFHCETISQAEIDQRSREARRHLEDIEALLVPGIRTTRWWVGVPLHATALGDQLQVPVPLRRRAVCHSARTRRHNDHRIRMTLADLTVDIVAIIGAVTGKRRNRACNLLQQGTDLLRGFARPPKPNHSTALLCRRAYPHG